MMIGDPKAPVPDDDFVMITNPCVKNTALNAAHAPHSPAPQHIGPRPLPLFLAMLQNEALTKPAIAAAALAGLKKMQSCSPAAPQTPRKIVARAGRAVLRDYGGNGPVIVVIPSLINSADILDITPERSLLHWLSEQGLHPYLVDWGDVGPERHQLSVADHITACLLPLIKSLNVPVQIIGYCLGGTMALAAAQHLRPLSLTLIATPWHFSRYPASARTSIEKLWRSARITSEQLGVLPIEVLQLLFWQLDPAGTIEKYARFNKIKLDTADADLFLAIERWANSGVPLPHSAAQELFENLFEADLSGANAWRVGGQIISPDSLTCPILNIVSTNDRIVPQTTAIAQGQRLDISHGHVGIITGRHAKESLWLPLREWLSHPHKH